MKIIIKNYRRLLVKDDGSEVNIDNGDVVEYTGVYYNHIKNEISDVFEKETFFVGIVDTHRSREGIIQGIYIKPIYIWSILKREWLKINDYKPPLASKYFLYPHLLMLPEMDCNYKPLYFLNSCRNIQLSDFNSITKEFSLNKTDYN
jgi:hypothetical protein